MRQTCSRVRTHATEIVEAITGRQRGFMSKIADQLWQLAERLGIERATQRKAIQDFAQRLREALRGDELRTEGIRDDDPRDPTDPTNPTDPRIENDSENGGTSKPEAQSEAPQGEVRGESADPVIPEDFGTGWVVLVDEHGICPPYRVAKVEGDQVTLTDGESTWTLSKQELRDRAIKWDPDEAPSQETTQITLSDESDEHGQKFVLTKYGSVDFGHIDTESGLQATPIRLSEGIITDPATNSGYGLAHIEARHGNEIRKAGFQSVLEFIQIVARNYEKIREGKSRNGEPTYLLQLNDKHNNTLIVELSKDSTYWNINTAGIFKESYARGNKVVYDRQATINQPAEVDEGAPTAEQSGTQTEASPLPSTSDGKVSNFASEKQVYWQKSLVGKSALQRVPKDSKGEPMFESTDHETAWDALIEYCEGDAEAAKEIAEAMVEEKKKAFEKAQKLKLKGKTPAEMLASKKVNAEELNNARHDYEQWQHIAGVEQKRMNEEVKETALQSKKHRNRKYSIMGKQGATNLDASEEATTRMDNLGVARQMETEDKEPLAIKQATGWERGGDGKWRYEVPDYGIEEALDNWRMGILKRQLTDNAYKELQSLTDRKARHEAIKEHTQWWGQDTPTKGVRKRTTLGKFLGESNPLFAAYPQLKDVKLTIGQSFYNGENGHYSYNERAIYLNSMSNDISKTLVHEIQHAIQHIEEFSQGGNLSTKERLIRDLLDDEHKAQTELDEIATPYFEETLSINKRIREGELKGDAIAEERSALRSREDADERLQAAKAKRDAVRERRLAIYNMSAESVYNNLMGEVEARNASERMNFSEEERRQKLLEETEDVSREDQIFIQANLDKAKQSLAQAKAEAKHWEDIAKTPERRINQLLDAEPTNAPDRQSYIGEDKKSQPKARQDLTTSSLQKVDTAKLKNISHNLSKLAEKFKGKTDKHGVFTDLSNAIGAIKRTPDSSSDYAVIALPNGNEAEIRISNHNANAATFAEHGHTQGNVSVVIKSRRSPNTFKAHPEVELTEYVYTTEAIAGDGDVLSGIAESLQTLITTGEYKDLTGKAIVNQSIVAPDRQSYISGKKKEESYLGRVELNVSTSKDPESRKHIRKILSDHNFSQSESDELLGMIDTIGDEVMRISQLYPEVREWQMVPASRRGEGVEMVPKRSAFVKNGDYELNIDLGTLCVKRESLDAMMKILVDEGSGQNLGPSQLQAIRDVLKKWGYLVQCDLCFVETKRARHMNFANDLAQNWNAVCEAIGVDAEFGKGELTPEQREALTAIANGDMSRIDKAKMRRYETKANGEKGDNMDFGLTEHGAKRIAKLMLEDEAIAGRLRAESLMTTEDTEKLLEGVSKTGFPAYLASFKGAATGKPMYGFNVYDPLSVRERYDQGFMTKATPEERLAAVFGIGGVRNQSFTDFNPMLFFDYCQMYLDLQARRLPLHTYTKVPALIELFGETGGMFNMSLVPGIDPSLGNEYAGLKLKPGRKKGSQNPDDYDYLWVDESFPPEKAFELRKRKEYGGRVGTTAVGVSDMQIRKMLADENIDQVIPYHSSGMDAAVKVKTGLEHATDYQDYQTTKYNGKDAKKWDFNEAMQRLKDPHAAAQEYLDWCKENGYTPKFEMFTNEKNYYKMLADFRCIDGDGKPVVQGAVKLKLPENFADIWSNAMKERHGQMKAIDEMKDNSKLMEDIHRVMSKQRLDGDIREEMMKGLNRALGKGNVKALAEREFFDALDKAYQTQGMSAEASREKVEVLRQGDGMVYGFAQGRKITLNENLFNANTPAHEFGHIWAKVVRASRPELWQEGKELLKQSRHWENVVGDELYADIRDNEDAVASEVLSREMGELNEDIIREMMDNSKARLAEKGIKAKILEWLQKAWEVTRGTFCNQYSDLTLEEFIRMPIRDLWDAKAGTEFKKKADAVFKRKKDNPLMSAEVDSNIEHMMLDETSSPTGSRQSFISGKKREEEFRKEFAELFGTDEHKRMVEVADRVRNLEATSLDDVRGNLDKRDCKAIVESLGEGVNKHDGRKVRFVKKTIGKLLGHKGFDYSILIPKLKELYESSIPAFFETEETKPGHKDHTSNFVGYHNYLNKVSLRGKSYYVRFTLQELRTKKKNFVPNEMHNAHVTEVSNIEIFNTDGSVISGNIDPTTGAIIGAKVDTKLQKFFLMSSKTNEEFEQRLQNWQYSSSRQSNLSNRKKERWLPGTHADARKNAYKGIQAIERYESRGGNASVREQARQAARDAVGRYIQTALDAKGIPYLKKSELNLMLKAVARANTSRQLRSYLRQALQIAS